MKPAEIKILLEKFYEGNTSEMEEAKLRQYFDQEHVASELLQDKAYFDLFQSLKKSELDSGFDQRLMANLVETKSSGTFRNRFYSISGIAAAALILISIWFGTDWLQPKEVYGTINDPVVAFAQTKKVLDEVSKKMNEGIKPASTTINKVEENVEKTNEIKKVDKALKKADNIKKINETMDLFNRVTVSFGG